MGPNPISKNPIKANREQLRHNTADVREYDATAPRHSTKQTHAAVQPRHVGMWPPGLVYKMVANKQTDACKHETQGVSASTSPPHKPPLLFTHHHAHEAAVQQRLAPSTVHKRQTHQHKHHLDDANVNGVRQGVAGVKSGVFQHRLGVKINGVLCAKVTAVSGRCNGRSTDHLYTTHHARELLDGAQHDAAPQRSHDVGLPQRGPGVG